MARKATHYIRINDEIMWLDPEALAENRLRAADMGEQCESCGSDIIESGVIKTQKKTEQVGIHLARTTTTRVVLCQNCKEEYPIIKASKSEIDRADRADR